MKKWICLLMALMVITALCGCSGDPGETETDPTGWTPEPVVKRDLTALISEQEVSDAVGSIMQPGDAEETKEGGNGLIFYSEDYSVQVVFLLEDEPVGGAEAYLDMILSGYGEGALITAPNLGRAAFWCGDSGELLVRNDSRVFSVMIRADRMDDESCLIAARQIAAKVLERL